MDNKNQTMITVSKINSPKDLALTIKKNLMVVIKITASWCGPCKNQVFLESYQNLKSKYLSKQNIKFVELDIDSDSDILEDEEYYKIKIDSIPTFLISSNGSFTKKFMGTGFLINIDEYITDTIRRSEK